MKLRINEGSRTLHHVVIEVKFSWDTLGPCLC
jgi:hypothetical protein